MFAYLPKTVKMQDLGGPPMRMWTVDPGITCRLHLLREHAELHMFIGAINRGNSPVRDTERMGYLKFIIGMTATMGWLEMKR